MDNDQIDLAPYLPVILIVLLVFFPAIAALVAPPDRRGTFFLLTLFVLPGPLGVACASVAQARLAYVPGMAVATPSCTPAAEQPRHGATQEESTGFVPGRWGLDWSNPFK